MLVFTNRDLSPGAGASAFQRSFAPGANRVGVAGVARDAAGKWQLSAVDDDVTERDALDLLLPLFGNGKPLLVFLHGNSNTPQTCFQRCVQLESEYNVKTVFSRLPFTLAYRVRGEKSALEGATFPSNAKLVEDWEGNPLALFESEWSVRLAQEWSPALHFEPFTATGALAAAP